MMAVETQFESTGSSPPTEMGTTASISNDADISMVGNPSSSNNENDSSSTDPKDTDDPPIRK